MEETIRVLLENVDNRLMLLSQSREIGDSDLQLANLQAIVTDLKEAVNTIALTHYAIMSQVQELKDYITQY